MDMKFHILSDLHIDSYARRGLPIGNIPDTDADAIILAGDISNASLGMQWAGEQASKLAKPILYVAGNHEYFGHDVLEFDATLGKLSKDLDVVFLQKQRWQMDNVRVLGCTLWTDFEFGTRPEHHTLSNIKLFNKWQSQAQAMDFAKDKMRDYFSIQHGGLGGLLTPRHVAALHQEHKNWLEHELEQAKTDGVVTVVVTHHSISALSIASKYAMSPSNGAFVSDLSPLMRSDTAPKLWIHGHTHDAFDYTLGNTRVVVNPRAYPSEVSSTEVAFDWAKVVEV